MLDHRHYMPILKWRMGEWQALEKLHTSIKDKTVPLLEIPEEKWDFETASPAISIDDHLTKLSRSVQKKWQNRLCYFDFCFIEQSTRMSNGQHPLAAFFDLVRASGHNAAIPVTGISRDQYYQAAVASTISIDNRGVCIRLIMDDFDRPSLATDLSNILSMLRLTEADTDIVIDCKAGNFSPITIYARTMEMILTSLPMLARWRSVTVAGTSFPAQLPSSTFRPYGILDRTEWLGYKALCNNLPGNIRVPTFGDYAVAHPATEKLDLRMVDPTAKLKYTINDQWYIAVGMQVKAHGRAQMQKICEDLVTSGYFSGSGFSWGDEYIGGCAAGTESTGGPSTFPTVATNHHITKIVTDVASFHGP